MIGEQVGSYRITGVLGEGGMGVVYLAEHPVIGQRAAVKVLREKFSGDREVVGRFFQEARAAALVKHAGVVKIYDSGHHAATGSAYITMEYLDGEPLARRIESRGPLPEEDNVRIAQQIASALSATHKKGIIHRDLKPDNVFLVPDPEAAGGEQAKIVDFGVAKLTAHHGISQVVRTRTGMVVGSPAYMAPEQCKGGGTVDSRADVYSLGCVMFEMATGQPPYRGTGVVEIIAQKLYQPPPRVRPLAPAISPALEEVIERAMAKAPGGRYRSMDELGQALAAVARREPLPRRRPRRPGWILIGVALLAFAAAAVWLTRVPSARLRIRSVPAGASVYRVVDGVRLGTTPFERVYDGGRGEMDFVLRKEGYRDERVTMSIERDAEAMVTLKADSSPRTPP